MSYLMFIIFGNTIVMKLLLCVSVSFVSKSLPQCFAILLCNVLIWWQVKLSKERVFQYQLSWNWQKLQSCYCGFRSIFYQGDLGQTFLGMFCSIFIWWRWRYVELPKVGVFNVWYVKNHESGEVVTSTL